MSEYDEERFYYNNENDEFQNGLPNILNDGFFTNSQSRLPNILRDNIYSNGPLPDYLNDLSDPELIAINQAERQKRLDWLKQNWQQQRQDQVAQLSPAEKLLEAVEAAAKHLPGEVAEEIRAIFTPATLATMVGVFAAYIAAHATGIGQAMDIGMLIAGGIFFGLDAFAIFKDLAGFAGAINATSEEELDDAGEHLASAIAKIGVDAVMTLLTKKVADRISSETANRPTASHGRNLEPLTDAQIAEVKNYAQELGIPEESLAFTQFNTAYGNMFGMERVQVGSDVAPLANPPQSGITANSRISVKGSLAHEWIGHGGASRAGHAFDRGGLYEPNTFNIALDEAQASIRAARFAPGLTPLERYILLRDGIARLKKEGIRINEVRHLLYIERP